jgi:hypothetical protein
MKHLLRDRKGQAANSKCGEAIKPEQATVWATDVTCPTCLEQMGATPAGDALERRRSA